MTRLQGKAQTKKAPATGAFFLISVGSIGQSKLQHIPTR